MLRIFRQVCYYNCTDRYKDRAAAGHNAGISLTTTIVNPVANILIGKRCDFHHSWQVPNLDAKGMKLTALTA